MPNEMNPQEVAKGMLERIDRPYSAHAIALDETEIGLLRRIANGELVKVIRCDHCGHYEELWGGNGYCHRIGNGYLSNPDDYCNHARRKDDNHEAN